MSGKRVARHTQSRSVKRGLIAVVTVVAAVGVAFVLAFGALPGTLFGESDKGATSQQSSSDDAATRTQAPNTRPSASTRPSPSAAPSSATKAPNRAGLRKLRACATTIHATERAVRAADIGVSHWKSHVQARSDMLEGRISMKEMDSVWARTQAAGPLDQKRFRQALRASGQPSKCDLRISDMSPADRQLAAHCVQRSRSATRALSSAEAAMKDWRVHLANMAKFANNKMSASMAQGRWVKAWRNAPKKISAFRTARDALNEAPTCPRAAP